MIEKSTGLSSPIFPKPRVGWSKGRGSHSCPEALRAPLSLISTWLWEDDMVILGVSRISLLKSADRRLRFLREPWPAPRGSQAGRGGLDPGPGTLRWWMSLSSSHLGKWSKGYRSGTQPWCPVWHLHSSWTPGYIHTFLRLTEGSLVKHREDRNISFPKETLMQSGPSTALWPWEDCLSPHGLCRC